ncbi:non-canonical purine NTP pyrophosphatase, RdgB/HAM1 family, partial [Frankia sp. EI5c]
MDSVGLQGLLAMAAGVADRSATATTALGYADATGVRVFTGTVRGTLTTEPRGSGGFGYDTIFVPAGSALTLAEMSSEEK